MRELPNVEPGSRAHWWLATMLVAIVFVPLGLLFGLGFADMVRSGEIADPGLTMLGYVVVWSPGVVSAACLETVALRLASRPFIWLGCASLALTVLLVLAWRIYFLIAVVLVMGWDYWWIAVGAIAIAIVLAVAAERVTRHPR